MAAMGDLRASAGRMRWRREVDKWRGAGRRRHDEEEQEDEEELVEVLLRGKAPWGFTLRGGTEHREPLVITKVEQGSAAAAVRLLAGDEMLMVNAVPLSGSRQEAICLVKSSHKTLTLVVRRKNDPGSRPHSWHSSKLTEEEAEPAGREAPPAPVWQPQHEARPEDLPAPGDQNSQRRFSSVNNMERLDRPSHPFPPGRLSPTKYMGGADPPTGPAGKRDSAFSCFSNGSSPPVLDQSTSGRKGASAENIFFKGLQSEGLQQAGRPRYHQPAPGNGGWEGSRAEEQPATRVSVAGRLSIGPVWQVPEKKSQSPPPPPPPLRSDSFAATKVFPYPEGPSHGRSAEKLTDNNHNGLRPPPGHSFPPPAAKDSLHPHTAADHNHNQLPPNKLFSLSSNDVRQSPHAPGGAHQRQYSDESPYLYLQTRSAPPAKTQSVGSYYRSLQDLPTNLFNRKHVRHSTASMTGAAAANPHLEGWGHSRHHGPGAELQARQRAEGRTHWVNEPGFSSSLKYSLPQAPYSQNKERNGHAHPGNGLHQTSEDSYPSRSPEDAAKRAEGHNDAKRHFSTHLGSDHKVGLSRQQDPWVPQEDHRISPLKTPLLHSLAQESRSLAERPPAASTAGAVSPQDPGDTAAAGSGKVSRRSDRYATTLRKEIQQKRAQLQKSRSAATLTCEAEDEEAEEWRSTETSTSSGASFSNIYKDHLKEAQARVLQATSFQRRDLEPLGPEAPVAKTSNGRVRGRKRLPLAKRTHSFSEPDKIDKVGVELEPQRETFGERRRFFEAKPAFSRPVLKSSQSSNLNTDLGETSKLKESPSSAAAAPEEPRSEPGLLGPGPKQTWLEQQRLGTFAEYQATWNKQKKSPEAKTPGRYHSAENILDADAEEKVVCTHERSRSSPSADFYAQNIPSSWRDPQEQQSSSTSRGEAENRSPRSAPSEPGSEGPAPGLSDHGTKSNAANPSQTARSSGPGRHSPNPGSQHAALPPHTKGLLPPPRTLLGPETTSSSQEFLAASRENPAALQPLCGCSSDTQHRDTSPGSSAGPAPASSPRLSWTSPPDVSKGEVEPEQEKEPPPPPPSPRSSWTAPLSLPTADRVRSPSPQFAPLRLTDTPPAVKDDPALRSGNEPKLSEVMDVNSPARKVPVKIVHAETSSDREGRAYLPHSGEDTCAAFQPPPYTSCLGGATEHPVSSMFSAYVRQAPQDPGRGSSLAQETDESSAAGVQRSEEDAKREELARDIMGKDKSLVDILDQSGRKTTMDLMEGLFPPEEQILEGAQRRKTSTSSRPTTTSPRNTDRRGAEEEEVSASAAASLVPSSSYYNTSAPKAELLIKMKDMQEQLEEQDSEDELDIDLASKKQELISSLARKLEVLREARQSLQEDVEDNEALGREVEVTVQRLCQPNQLDKFRMFVGDLDKVVSLLLSLSGRLARVENALNGLEDEASPEEKQNLTEKRKLLMRQHEDAKELKENLDRRERLVSGIMEVHLDAESLDDYRHFVKMKSALIIEQRKLEDKVKLGEEQLKCLLDSLPPEQRPPPPPPPL